MIVLPVHFSYILHLSSISKVYYLSSQKVSVAHKESIGFNIKRKEVAVWGEELAVQKHTDGKRKEPPT